MAASLFSVGGTAGENRGSIHRQHGGPREGTEPGVRRGNALPLVAMWKPRDLQHWVPRTKLSEIQFPHLYNLKGFIVSYQHIFIEYLVCTRPGTARAWHIVEA